MAKVPIPREPLTPEDLRAITALQRCTYLPGSADKRFVRKMFGIALERSGPGITRKQRAFLWSLVVKYRRQHQEMALLKLAEAQGMRMPR